MKSLNIIALSVLSLSTFANTLGGYSVSEESLCHGFPKAQLETPEGTCVGIVATQEDGLKRPRRILALPGGDFIITDMTGWVANKGIVWRFNPTTNTLSKVFTGIDHAHGLALGPDGLVYFGSKAQIFSFDPAEELPQKRTVLSGLPTAGNHPLTHFIFDEEGNLLVNVGAPSDQCLDEKDRPQYPCPESEGKNPEAVIRKYSKSSNYQSYEVIAKGLRNSMALAIEPLTGQLYQGENGMDFKELETPLEEINLITKGKHYGWPYCYEDGLLNPKYKRTFFNRRIPKIDCSVYESPVAHLPAHSAPLDMMFYQGDMFEELNGKLVVSLHGYRETGHRIVSLDLNEQLIPSGETRKELVTNWSGKNGLTPKGSPVGMTVAKDGAIWFVEDKNKTIMVFAKGSQAGQNNQTTQTQISYKDLTHEQAEEFSFLNKAILKKSCTSCHGQMAGDDESVFNTLIDDGFIKPGNKEESSLHFRILNNENGNQMPLGGKPVDTELTNKLGLFIDALKTP